jgi:catechol 2,3-dioxygenase-like lactoylglutathione lyase family enzyme
MERLISRLVREFEQGAISRRDLILSLTVASAASTLNRAEAADRSALRAGGIHHISYQVADYAKARDFYANLLGATVSEDNGKQCVLTFGDVRFIARNGMAGHTPFVDHIAYAIENWNQDAVLAELKSRGLNPEPEGDNSLQLKDPDGFHVQLSAKR